MAVTFQCPKCKKVSHNPNDVREQYCGACHDWTGLDPEGDWFCGRCGGTLNLPNPTVSHSDCGYGEVCYSCLLTEIRELETK